MTLQPFSAKNSACSRVSTPSATVDMPRPEASVSTVLTISLEALAGALMPSMNDLSILRLAMGIVCR